MIAVPSADCVEQDTIGQLLYIFYSAKCPHLELGVEILMWPLNITHVMIGWFNFVYSRALFIIGYLLGKVLDSCSMA